MVAFSSSNKAAVGHTLRGRQPQLYVHVVTSGTRPTVLSGAMVVGRPSGGPSSAKSPQRAFSVMQNAMKIPGLASALHLIGMYGPGGSNASTDSTVAAAGGPSTNGGGMTPAPDDRPSPLKANYDTSSQQQQSQPTSSYRGGGNDPIEAEIIAASAAGATDASATAKLVSVHETAATSTADNHGNRHLAQLNTPVQHLPAQMEAASAVNSLANGTIHRHEGVEEVLGSVDPGSRAENNITPYTTPLPSLAAQIREIASTLRHINSLRLEYLDKISQQELELAAKDQVLRSREERIQSLEHEAVELRRSLALLHSAKSAAEVEVQRLRSWDSKVATSPSSPAPNATLTAAAAALQPAQSAAAAVAAAASAPFPVPEAAPPMPRPLTSPPAAIAAPACATLAACPPASMPPVSTPDSTPAPPPTARVLDIVLSYRSSWPQAFLHCNVEGKGWTLVPGLRMENAGPKEYSIRVQGRSLEFVLTNGHGEWDSPGGGGIGRNYHIDTPGDYRLHYGVLTQVKPWQP
ncbi:hypothetical protein VaNZ11_012030 [Volvox africanus]|uniref:Carbohydrate binding module family 25 domain-containing protein n=1 Tax=Volvox africanus TaxID=51714 RepID=A0ABQ5SD15_9CHLO|nr:hypothetical protein VaNZ11_012030 [Volvox africanus]